MRALEHGPQLSQKHLNLRRFRPLFTGTIRTSAFCLVQFQIISQHTQGI